MQGFVIRIIRSLMRRVDGEEEALSHDMGSVAVSDESSELVSRLALRRYRLSKPELAMYRHAMAPGEPTAVRAVV